MWDCEEPQSPGGFQKKTKWEAARLPTSRRTAKLQHQDGAALAESGRVSDRSEISLYVHVQVVFDKGAQTTH